MARRFLFALALGTALAVAFVTRADAREVHVLPGAALSAAELPQLLTELTTMEHPPDGDADGEGCVPGDGPPAGRLRGAVGSARGAVTVLFGLPRYMCSSENGVAIASSRDGGDTWRVTGWADGAFEEAFFLTSEHGWLLTQWAIEGSFPSLFRIDHGLLSPVLAKSGHGLSGPAVCPVTYAWNLMFRDESKGWVQVACGDGSGDDGYRAGIFVMRTEDGGLTWRETHELPEGYAWTSPRRGDGLLSTRFENRWFVEDPGTLRFLPDDGPAERIADWRWPVSVPELEAMGVSAQLPGRYRFVPLGDGLQLAIPARGLSSSPQSMLLDEWYLIDPEGGRRLVARDLSCMFELFDVELSPDGRFLASLFAGEGHPCVQVIDMEALTGPGSDVRGREVVLHEIDPYPGTIGIDGWQGDRLQIRSDMLLTHRFARNGRVPFCLWLRESHGFSFDPVSGAIEPLTPETSNPAAHFGASLLGDDEYDLDRGVCAARWLGATDVLPALRVVRDRGDSAHLSRKADRSIRALERLDRHEGLSRDSRLVHVIDAVSWSARSRDRMRLLEHVSDHFRPNFGSSGSKAEAETLLRGPILGRLADALDAGCRQFGPTDAICPPTALDPDTLHLGRRAHFAKEDDDVWRLRAFIGGD